MINDHEHLKMCLLNVDQKQPRKRIISTIGIALKGVQLILHTDLLLLMKVHHCKSVGLNHKSPKHFKIPF